MADSKINDGGLAFPGKNFTNQGFANGFNMGMSLRDWFAGQALSNPQLCPGTAPELQLDRWFGGRSMIDRWDVAAKQAYEHADAMIAARKVGA